MAEDGDDRTELATERRLEDEASKGHHAYSKEITAALLLLSTILSLKLGGSNVVVPVEALFRRCLSLQNFAGVTAVGIGSWMRDLGTETLTIVAPMLLLAVGITLAAAFLQVGVSFDARRLEWRWEKLNPIAGFGKLFRIRSLLPMGTSLLKLLAVGWIAWITVSPELGGSPMPGNTPVSSLAVVITRVGLQMALRTALFLLFLGLADVFIQRFLFRRDTMMTKQEVKEERKNSEGDEKIKGRIKQRQREIARAKMMREVRKATVIIRNPTHFAVALQYRRGEDSAPRLLAKGQDVFALRIIAEAEKHGVPVVSKPEVAREIYRTVKVGGFVPLSLYKAVAAILAYVLRTQRRQSSA